MPAPIDVQADLERFENDAVYFDQHRDELLRQFPERWVTVYRQEVVGASKSLKTLIRQLLRKGIPPARVYREYLTEKDEILILAATLL